MSVKFPFNQTICCVKTKIHSQFSPIKLNYKSIFILFTFLRVELFLSTHILSFLHFPIGLWSDKKEILVWFRPICQSEFDGLWSWTTRVCLIHQLDPEILLCGINLHSRRIQFILIELLFAFLSLPFCCCRLNRFIDFRVVNERRLCVVNENDSVMMKLLWVKTMISSEKRSQ